MQVTLESQLILARKWVALLESKSRANAGDSSHPAHGEVETAKGIVETIETRIGCRDCGTDWDRKLEVVK